MYVRVSFFLIAVVALAALASRSTAQTPGSCSLGTAQADLDVNNVRARSFTTGSLGYGNRAEAQYVVPKLSGHSPLYASNIWIGGLVDGELRVEAATYNDFEMWPGPLGEDGRPVTPSDCSAYDYIWKVSASDVAEYDQTGEATDDLASWPYELGAPVIDGDGDPDNYDLAGGDRPEIVGDQALWWVMNDAGNTHDETGSAPIGMEVRVTAFSARSGDAVNDATFYRYELVYKGDEPLEDAYFSVWTDVDLGDAGDDHVGVDTTRDLGFGYNAGPIDNVYGTAPAVGIDLLQGPVVDGDTLGMTRFTYTINSGPVGTTQATTAEEHYSVMQGNWADGTPMTAYGLGYRGDGDTTKFAFAGDPVTDDFWSRVNIDGEGTDAPGTNLNMIITTGPFTMQPGEKQEILYSVVWAQAEDHLTSITALREASDVVQAAYESGFEDFTTPLPALPASAPTLASPGDGATAQPRNPTMTWYADVDGAESYIIEWSPDPSFPDSVRGEELVRVDGQDLLSKSLRWLPPSVTLFWRVRGMNAAGEGPYSEVRSFSTSDVELVSPGPLMHGGTPVFVEVRAPGGANVCEDGGYECDEFGGDFVTSSVNSTGQYFRYYLDEGSESSIGAFAPHTFEIRFVEPEEGSYVVHHQTDGTIARWPIQMWDIGVVAPGEENDESDDVRLIPAAFSDGNGACALQFGESNVRGYSGTDRLFAYYPADGFTYDDWASHAAGALGEEPCAAPTDFDAREIDFERGTPLQNEVFGVTDSTTTVADLEGAIVRYYTTPFSMMAPVPAAPADSTARIVGTMTLWWSAAPGADATRLQVALSPGFEADSIVVDTPVSAESRFRLGDLQRDTDYYWRLQAVASEQASDWSPVWTFYTGERDDPGEPTGLPEDFVLQSTYPNPFREQTTIVYGLPEAADVTLTVYDVLGREVAVMEEGRVEAGWQEVVWRPSSLASGIYVMRMEAGGTMRTATLVRVQ